MGHRYLAKIPDTSGNINWTEEENKIWSNLINRQVPIIQNSACKDFLKGLELLGFSHECVPDYKDLNRVLAKLTNWKIKPVAAIISDDEFHTLLSNKYFPAASFIRIEKELDYIEEPDIFHEFFGHLPLLTNQKYVDFLEKFGRLMTTLDIGLQKYLARIFWFTVEFGIVNTNTGVCIYGAGILSSYGETLRVLESPNVEHIKFDLLKCARTPYDYSVMQSKYFMIEDMDELYKIFDEPIIEILEKARILGDIIS